MPDKPEVRFGDRTTPPHLATLILMAGVSALAMNVFLPSLPNMAAYFDTDYRVMQLAVTLYLAMTAVLQLVIGPVADRFGRRPVLLASIVLFMLATLGTILATSAEAFLAFRLGQAVIVSAMVLSRAVVRDMVGDAEAASMLGYLTMGMTLVPMLGPILGGALDEAFGWQASFVLLWVCGLVLLVVTWADMGETATNRPASFRAQFAQYPELLSSRRFWGYCASMTLSSGAFFAFLGGGPFVGVEVFGVSPAQLGFYLGITAFGYIVGNYFSGRYSVRIGLDRMILWGALIASAGLAVQLALYALGLRVAWIFFAFYVFMGLGNGLLVPNATAGMLSVRQHLAGTAAGIGGAISIGGGAALAGLAGALLVPGSGAYPLILIMLGSTLASVVAVLYVMRRARNLGAG